MPHKSQSRSRRDFTPNHPRREFDARLRAYTAAGRAALATGAALGATAVVQAQVTNLTGLSFTGDTSASVTSLPAHSTSNGPATRTDFAVFNIKSLPDSPGGRFSVRQKIDIFRSYIPPATPGPSSSNHSVIKSNNSASGGARISGTSRLWFRVTGDSQLRKLGQGVAVNLVDGNWGHLSVKAFYTQGFASGYASTIGRFLGQSGRGQFTDGQPGYAGFRASNGAGAYYYGWFRVQVGKDANGRPSSISLVAQDGIYGAYNATPGGLITAGETAAVPEPASAAAGLALFALGAVGVREFRRRRNAAERDAVKA